MFPQQRVVQATNQGIWKELPTNKYLKLKTLSQVMAKTTHAHAREPTRSAFPRSMISPTQPPLAAAGLLHMYLSVAPTRFY